MVPVSRFLPALLAAALAAPASAQTFSGDFSLSSGAVYQTAGTDEARAVAVDTWSAGGPFVYVAGDTGGVGNIVKYDSAGNALSSAPFVSVGSGAALGVAVAPNGEVWTVGYRLLGNTDWFVLRSSANLVPIASTSIAGASLGANVATSIVFDGSGNAFVAGYTSRTVTGTDFQLVKYSPALVMLSSAVYGGSGIEQANALALDASGNVYLAGLVDGTNPYNWLTVKFNSSLVVQSTAAYDAAGGSDRAYGIAIDANGAVFVTGQTDSGGANYAFTTIKYNSSLAQQAVVSYNTGASDSGFGVMVVGTNTVVAVGDSYGGATEDMVVATYNAGLFLQSTSTYDAGNSDRAYAVAKGTGSYMYVTGYSFSPTANYRTLRLNTTSSGGGSAPAAPSGFSGTALSSFSILWSWTDNSSDETGFRVMSGAANLSGDLPAGTTTWTQTGLGPNASTGPLTAQAFNGGGTSNSGAASRHTLAAVPSSLSSSNVSLFLATVSWSAAGNPGSTVYQLERSTGSGFGLRQASSATLSFADSLLTPGATYQYQVRAVNGDGVASAYAGPLSVSPAPWPVLQSVTMSPPALTVPVSSAAVLQVVGTFNDGSTRTLSGVWAPRAPLLEARTDSAGAFSGGKLYVFGASGTGALPFGSFSAEAYDVATDSWSWRAASPVRRGGAFAAENAGKIYVAGGCTNGDCTGTLTTAVYEYDTVADAWTAKTSLPVARFDAAFETISGKLYAAGGIMSGYVSTTSVLMYDPGANTWTAKAPMPLARGLGASGVINGKMYVAGGRINGGAVTGAELQIYDPVANSWTLGAPMPSGRIATGGAVVNGRLYVISGQHDQSVPLSTDSTKVQIYDPVSNTWSDGPYLQASRYGPVVGAYQGKIYAAACAFGNLGSTALEVMNPDEGVWSSNAPSVATVTAAGVMTGSSAGSASVTLTTGALNVSAAVTVVGVPAAPTGLAGTALSTSSIRWTWTDASTTEDGFRVMNGAANASGDLAAGATTWTQTGLTPSTSATLFVQAFNSSGTANSAAVARYTAAAVPGTPTFSGVYQTSGTVAWSASGNPAAVVYQLERSTGTGFGLQFAGAATSYFDQYMSPGVTHYYRVLALNGDSVASAYSATNSVVAVGAPAAPLTAGTPAGTALGTSSITWTWVLASGATTHYLFRASDNSWIANSSAPPYIQTALSPNVAYGLRAAGVNVGGTGPLSPSGTAYTLAAPPASLGASAVWASSLTVAWGLNGNAAATTASVERSTNGVAYSTAAAGAFLSYSETDLLGCTTYHYRVRNANGDGLLTSYATAAVVTANTIAAPPSGLTAASNAGGTVTLGWNASPTEGITGYRLFWDGGSGTVSYAGPIATFSSGTYAYTTGVLASSASYTFALRAVHRCGVVETTGALAMSGAAVSAPAVRAVIKEPDSGKRINGNRVTILGELIYGTPSDVQQIAFQYKAAAASTWTLVAAADVNHSNPDLDFPYFVHMDVTALPAGDYDLRAVAYDRSGTPDSAPPAVRVTVTAVNPDINESVNGSTIKKDQVIANGSTSVVDTAGAGANDPAVRVTIPAGAVTAATATVSVTANPAITTAAPRGFDLVGSAIKIDLSNGQSALNGTASITLTYPDSVVFPSLLQIYYLNEATGQWSRDFTSTVDTASRTVTGATPHFSTFALLLGTAFAPNLDDVKVYPVPFKPNGGNPDEGRSWTASDANSGIIFANLAQGSEIKIYTLTGRLVASLDNAPITGTVRWDARNNDGRDAASGAYFAVIKAAGQKTLVKKLVIIR